MKLSHMFYVFVQYIVESARQRPARRRVSSSVRKSLYQKLYELYMEECEKEPELKVILIQHMHLRFTFFYRFVLCTNTVRSFKWV